VQGLQLLSFIPRRRAANHPSAPVLGGFAPSFRTFGQDAVPGGPGLSSCTGFQSGLAIYMPKVAGPRSRDDATKVPEMFLLVAPVLLAVGAHARYEQLIQSFRGLVALTLTVSRCKVRV
jgi:hypothetical protein